MEKLLSIIIPTYNVEKYLSQCLESLEIIKFENSVEVLIVNDGSTDSSQQIAEEFVIRNPNIMFLYSKTNGGYGSVINYGIERASGKYIRILDSDDWIDPKEYINYIIALQHEDSDIIATSFTMDNMSTREKVFFSIPRELEIGKKYSFEKVCLQGFVAMHMMTIKKSIFIEHEIKIDEKTYYTDLEFVIFPLKYVKTITYYDYNLYQYRIGIPGQSVSHEGWYKYRFDHEKVIIRLIDELNTYKNDSKLYKYIERELYKLLTVHFKMYTQFPLEKENLKRELIEFRKSIRDLDALWIKECNNIWAKVLVKSNFSFLKLEQLGFMLLNYVRTRHIKKINSL